MLINRAPHPNAAKVYINWLLSKEGAAQFTRITGLPSMRADAPTDHLVPWRIPVQTYIKTYDEKAHANKSALRKLLREVFKGR